MTSTSKTAKPTVQGVLDDLTYVEETAIRRRFQVNIEGMLKSDTARAAGRAVYFAHLLLTGVPEDEAYTKATTARYVDVNDFFAPDPVEIDDDKPETDEGKDGSSPG